MRRSVSILDQTGGKKRDRKNLRTSDLIEGHTFNTCGIATSASP